MKLRSKKSVKSGKEYITYEITLPKDLVEALGWKGGIELETRIIDIEGKKAIVLIPKG